MNEKNYKQLKQEYRGEAGMHGQGQGHALKAFVDALVTRLPERSNTEDQLGLVYLGNVHDAIPRLLILDQGLRLEERCVWQVMRIHINDPGRPASLLTQNQLATQCCVDLKTVRRYLHALRATRWITRCAVVRGRGTVWALHDEPLALADTLLLDPGYMQFVDECARSQHKRLRELGEGVMRSFHEDVHYGRNYAEPVSQLEQAARRMDALANTPRHHSLGSFFATTPENRVSIEHRENFPMGEHEEILPTRQTLSTTGKNSPCGQIVAKENSSLKDKLSCSSNNKNIHKKNNLNTTTTTNISTDLANRVNPIAREDKMSGKLVPPDKFSEHRKPEWLARLEWPHRLKASERMLLIPMLTKPGRDFETAQYLLHYLTDRLRAADRGDAKAVPNPVAYLIQVADLHVRGELKPSSWGLRNNTSLGTSETPNMTVTQTAPLKKHDAAQPSKHNPELKTHIAALKQKMRAW